MTGVPGFRDVRRVGPARLAGAVRPFGPARPPGAVRPVGLAWFIEDVSLPSHNDPSRISIEALQ